MLARSVFEHSVNYRCAMIYAVPRIVTDPAEKLTGLRLVSEHLAPGQWDYARPPSRKELAATRLLALSLAEASVKISDGGPSDGDSPDAALGLWAGQLPLDTRWQPPVPDAGIPAGMPVPAPHRRPGRAQPAHRRRPSRGQQASARPAAGGAAAAALLSVPESPAARRPGAAGGRRAARHRLTSSPHVDQRDVHRRADRDAAPLRDAPVEVGGRVAYFLLGAHVRDGIQQPGPFLAQLQRRRQQLVRGDAFAAQLLADPALAVVVGVLWQRLSRAGQVIEGTLLLCLLDLLVDPGREIQAWLACARSCALRTVGKSLNEIKEILRWV